MGNTVRVLLLTSLVMLVFTGCGPRNYSLPGSWPVPQVTLPPGSTIPLPPVEMHKQQTGLPDKNWGVFFDCPGATLDTAAAHIESCLKPLSYNEFWYDYGTAGTSRDAERTWYSPDGKTAIILMKGFGSGPKQVDFSLSIRVSSAPSPLLDGVGRERSGGQTTHLEPIQ